MVGVGVEEVVGGGEVDIVGEELVVLRLSLLDRRFPHHDITTIRLCIQDVSSDVARNNVLSF
jgi:hypothetical protein